MESVLFADMDFPEEIEPEPVGAGSKGMALKMKEARERMRKIMSGELAVESLEIPMQRMKHTRTDFPRESIYTIMRQLGFTPLNLVDVSYNHPYDHRPLILQLYPLNVRDPTLFQETEQDIIPFPTMFWVSCPVLHANISKLEMDGWIQKLSDRLVHSADSATYLAAMEKAHKLYAEERWSTLTEEDRQFVESSGWYMAL
ncbi:DUF501 domain-containing protein [archaeon]|nr:MAG: DUF501 domain-containing protein [archaeon]